MVHTLFKTSRFSDPQLPSIFDRERAMGRLRLLCEVLRDPRLVERALRCGGLCRLVTSVRSAKRKQRAMALRALRPLAARFAGEIGDGGGVEALVELVAELGDDEEKKLAWKVLNALTEGEEEAGARNRLRFADAGGLDLLVGSEGDEPSVASVEHELDNEVELDRTAGSALVHETVKEEQEQEPQQEQAEELAEEQELERESERADSEGPRVEDINDEPNDEVPPSQEVVVEGPSCDAPPVSVEGAFELLRRRVDEELALTALLEFSAGDAAAAEIVGMDGCCRLAQYLAAGYLDNGDAKGLALKTLRKLARLEGCRTQLDNRQYYKYIVEQVNHGNFDEKVAAMRLIEVLLEADAAQHSLVVEVGGVDAVSTLLESDEKSLLLLGLRFFSITAANQDMRNTLIRTQATIRRVVDLLTHEDEEILCHAAETLREWSPYGDTGLIVAVSGAILKLILLLQHGSEELRGNVRLAVQSLVLRNDDETLGVEFAIPTLVAAIKSLEDPRTKKSVVVRLERLARSTANRPLIIQYGGLAALVSFAQEQNCSVAKDALASLVLDRTAIGSEDVTEIIDAAVIVAQSGASARRLSAILLLKELANKEENLASIRDPGAMKVLLNILQDGNNSQCLSVINTLDNTMRDSASLAEFGRSSGLKVLTTLLHDHPLPKLCATVVRTLTYALLHMGGTLSIAKQAAITAFTDTLKSPDLDLSVKIAIVRGVASLSSNERLRSEIVKRDGVCRVSECLTTDSSALKLEAVRALRAMEQSASRYGVIPKLIDIVKMQASQELKLEALSTLRVLTGNISDRQAICDADGIPLIVDLVQQGRNDEKIVALGILQNVALSSHLSGSIVNAQGVETLIWVQGRGAIEVQGPATGALSTLRRSSKAIAEIDQVVRSTYLTIEGIAGGWYGQDQVNSLAEKVDGYSHEHQNRAILAMLHLARYGDMGEKKYAVIALQRLSENEMLMGIIASLGGAEVLISLLGNTSDFGQKTPASATMAMMYSGSVSNAAKVARESFENLIDLLSAFSETERTRAVRVISALSETETNRHAITVTGGIFALVKLLKSSSSAHNVDAARALWNLSLSTEIQGRIIKAGGIQALTTLMRDDNEHLKVTALQALLSLADSRKNAPAFVSAESIPQLIEVGQSGSDVQKALAMEILSKLLRRTKSMAAIVAAGGVTLFVDAISRESGAGRSVAVQALQQIAADKERCAAIVSAGGLEALRKLATVATGHEQEAAMETLRILEVDSTPLHEGVRYESAEPTRANKKQRIS